MGARAIAAAIVACAVVAPAGAAVPLPTRLVQALAVPYVSTAAEGVVAVDLTNGATLFQRHGDLPLAPASNEKLPVTFAALKELGPDYRFRTEVLGDGSQLDAVWHGDLVLKGFGDPTLSSAQLNRLAIQIARRGIRHVTGHVVGDESWFDAKRTAPGWKPSFYLSESPALSALAVDNGTYEGHAVLDPPIAAGGRFRQLLAAHGVTTGSVVRGRAPVDAPMLAQVTSAPLHDVIALMDRDSDNFVAEMVLKEIGAETGGAGTTAAGAAVVLRDLAAAGIGVAGVRIVDGSGLSLDDRITAGALAALLVVMWRDPIDRPLLWASLPVAGESGTLEHRLLVRPARGLVHAKTGTTDLASALSGYVGGRYAFAVIQNGHPVSWYWARQAQDRFAQALARVTRATH